MLEVIRNTVEGTHIVFFYKIMGKRARRTMWETMADIEVLRASMIQTLDT